MNAAAVSSSPRVLVVDLNNFARYPTVAVGYIIAALRDHGITTELFSPLSIDIPGMTRERVLRPWSLLDERLRYRTAVSQNKMVRSLRERIVQRRLPSAERNNQKILSRLRQRLNEGPDVILVSAYLMYSDLCEEICKIAANRGIPVVIGGAYFSEPTVVQSWLKMRGLTALVGGEAEPFVAQLVEAVAAGKDLDGIPGVSTPGGPLAKAAPPISNLDDLAFPDYSDFPWHKYPSRIIPMTTGRGCGWGVCSFCSDVTSSMGRTYRSRSADNVLAEFQHQAYENSASKFIFTDLKLNSNLPVWYGLIAEASKRVQGVEWAGAVHVGTHGDNGLSNDALRAARASGLVRVTTGLESGSQRLLDEMKKGTDLDSTSRFLKSASDADISVRTTMIMGYPGETEDDLRETADFLNRHTHSIERVSLNRMAIIAGTPLHRGILERPERFPSLSELVHDERNAILLHRNRATGQRNYRRAINQVLAAAHRINRRPLRPRARTFEGVM